MKALVAFRENGLRICSGTLISVKNVLTSAQCIFLNCEFSESQFCCKNAAYIEERKYDIERVKQHPNYDYNKKWKSYNFDLGLVDVSLFIHFLN